VTIYLPIELGVTDLIITAIVDLLTTRLQYEIDENDASRAALVKTGPRQANPESVAVMVHENDPDDPAAWPHKPLYNTGGGRVSESRLRSPGGTTLIGGGSQYSRAFTIEIEVFGNYISDLDVTRAVCIRVAGIVENRVVSALLTEGAYIGTGNAITDTFGETVIQGPVIASTWTDPEAGEALIVRKFLRIWYHTSKDWNL